MDLEHIIILIIQCIWNFNLFQQLGMKVSGVKILKMGMENLIIPDTCKWSF